MSTLNLPSFMEDWKDILIAYFVKFSYFIMKLFVVCTLIETILMTHLNCPHLPPNLTLWLTLSAQTTHVYKVLWFQRCKSHWSSTVNCNIMIRATFSIANHWRDFFKNYFYLLNDYCKSILCDLQLESGHYSCKRNLILNWINNINN